MLTVTNMALNSPFRFHPTRICFEGLAQCQLWLAVRGISSSVAAEHGNVQHVPVPNPLQRSRLVSGLSYESPLRRL